MYSSRTQFFLFVLLLRATQNIYQGGYKESEVANNKYSFIAILQVNGFLIYNSSGIHN